MAKSDFPLRAKTDDEVNNTFLNAHYGKKGMTFEFSKSRDMKATKKAAERYVKKLKKEYKDSYITPLFDYKSSDIYINNSAAHVCDGAKKKYYGYQVTVLNNNMYDYI